MHKLNDYVYAIQLEMHGSIVAVKEALDGISYCLLIEGTTDREIWFPEAGIAPAKKTKPVA